MSEIQLFCFTLLAVHTDKLGAGGMSCAGRNGREKRP